MSEDDVRELKQIMLEGFAEMRGEVGDLRGGVAGLHGDVGELGEEMRAGFSRMDIHFNQVDEKFQDQRRLIGVEFAKATTHADRLYGKLHDQLMGKASS